MMRAPSASEGRGEGAETLFAMLRIEGLVVFVPQEEIRTTQPALSTAPVAGPAVGQLVEEGHAWPVYRLNRDLEPVATVPPGTNMCALLRSDNGLFGLLCEGLKPVQAVDLAFHPLPECMDAGDGFVHSLAVHAGEIGCVLSVAALKALIEGHMTPADDQGSVTSAREG
jgi:hypothetical protein